MNTFGLIGYKLGHSFSAKYFANKFTTLNLENHEYVNFELDNINDFPNIFKNDKNICGLNCTIPYKQDVMQFLDEIDSEAAAVGAVNTIKTIQKGDKLILKGYNTDIVGFNNSLTPMLDSCHKKALILGTGGASKAIKHVLERLGIEFVSASIENNLEDNEVRYSDISNNLIKKHTIIINATPLGTFPKVDACPDIPYGAITVNHVMFDLVYNPEITLFLQKGINKGAKTKNGLEMLHGQAEAAWQIWND